MTDDPLKSYAALMSGIKAPEQLPKQVMQRAAAPMVADSDPAGPKHAVPRRQARPKRRRTAMIAVAACTVLAIGIGLFAALNGAGVSDSGNSAEEGQSGAAVAPFDFAVKAYAQSTDTLLPSGPDGMLVFDSTVAFSVPQKDSYAELGFYSGCLLRVSGDCIAQVSVSIDRGQLYGRTLDSYLLSDEPDRWKDAINVVEGRPITGTYAGYDAITRLAQDDAPDGDKQCSVGLAKLLGSSTTLGASELAAMDAGDYSIGLWTNEDFGQGTMSDGDYYKISIYRDIIDTLDGAHLTMSTTFNDGSMLTRVYELHSADLKYGRVGSAYDIADSVQMYPEFASPDDVSAIHTLYGTIVEDSYVPAADAAAATR